MNKRYICLVAIVLFLVAANDVSGKTFFSLFGKNIHSSVSLPILPFEFLVDVNALSSEINNAKSSEFPLYISELNSGLIYYTDYKNSGDVSISREIFFSKYDSLLKSWIKPINIEKEYSKFCEENKIMNFEEIFISIDNDIFRVDLKSKDYSVQKLNINTKGIEASPVLSPDGNTLYFVSDRKGGNGGKDIWASERLSNGNWSEPYNMGKDINSAFDEESPFIMSDGVTLYFSSKGPGTYGGFDIFITTQDYDGLWSKPENLGAPVNSTSDDYNYITDSFGKKAFYSSDKIEKGNQDIYSVIYNSFGK